MPDPRPRVFISSVMEGYRSGGSPATLGEMKKRCEDYLDDNAKGKDPRKVRIVPE